MDFRLEAERVENLEQKARQEDEKAQQAQKVILSVQQANQTDEAIITTEQLIKLALKKLLQGGSQKSLPA